MKVKSKRFSTVQFKTSSTSLAESDGLHVLIEAVELRQDLDSLIIWAEKWGMKFNVKKCYHLSVKQKSSHFYTMNGQILQHV